MEIFFLIFLKLAFSSAFEETYEGYEIKIYNECNVNLRMIVGLTVNYFEDQFSMTIIDPSENSVANAFRCVGGNKFRPINIFDDILQIDLGVETDTSSVSSYSLTHGMFVKVSFEDCMGILKIIASHNPRSKVLLHMTDGSVENSQDILKSAFEDLKMLNLAIVLSANDTIFLTLYNPFSGNNETNENLVLEFNELSINDNFVKMKNFLGNRLRNLNQFPLRVNIFEFPMTSRKEENDEGDLMGYSYVDGVTVQVLSERMNFQVIYTDSPDGVKYGSQSEDGNFTGSLGTIENDIADLLGNPRLIANYNTTKTLFLQPIKMMRLYFIIKRRETFKMLIVSIYSQYDHTSTVLGITISILFPFIFYLINKLELKVLRPEKKAESVIRSMTYAFALQQNISMKHSTHAATRIVILAILFYTLITSSLFQSSVTKNLNTNQVKGKITSVEGLMESSFKIGMPPYITSIFRDRNGLNKVNTLMRHSGQTIEDVRTPIQFFDGFLKSSYKNAFLWSDLYVDNFLNQFYDSESGENSFETIPENVYQFYISLMAPKSSPFIERFNEVLLQFVETGIGNYHINRARADNDMIWIWRIMNGKTPRPPDKAIKLNDLKSLFEIYFYLCTLCLFVFLMELLIFKISKKKLKEKKVKKVRKSRRVERPKVVLSPTQEVEKVVLKFATEKYSKKQKIV